MHLNTREDLLLAEGLEDIVHAPGLKPLHDLLGLAVRGDVDHRDVPRRGVRLEPAADLEPVQVRHLNVQQDQVRRRAVGQPERHLPAGRCGDLVTRLLQGVGQKVQVGRRVVHDQNLRARQVHKAGRHGSLPKAFTGR
ncbi:MAG: hypothetical protein A3F84_09445 [Candidatus Handelsmanbacteria bacterium RIFCSPLOWO2_12_FULL_64_10]|uniref:Uncharacterized protein n=1 Tax=Handelsmanbacteria sp. (strain RIFCSPLOWO2_12_FULL_64_10) TaxID=1817868 RepID=A0A1F6C4T9_HANXR|nr:MAG: hypothetical protein A3F84_09445 [Candidatus Handelsmanbacteria bacterium RIFCSPLOWO2_12_FULL_64_10]